MAAGANGDRQALDDGAVALAPASRVHAIVDGEVAADEVGMHGGILARQRLRRVQSVRLVFAVVHAHAAAEMA